MKKSSQISHYQDFLMVFFKDQPVRRAYLSGSFVRGENRSGSDLDILVELEPGTGLFKFISIQNQLQIALKMKIDLVSANGLSPKIKPYIDSEKILVYEKQHI
jgi:predicted nucleotidyltransferase